MADINETKPTIKKSIMVLVIESFQYLSNLRTNIARSKNPAKAKRISSILMATKVPEIRNKGNFGYKGTPIRIAATVYLINPSSNHKRFSIGQSCLLPFKYPKDNNSTQSSNFKK